MQMLVSSLRSYQIRSDNLIEKYFLAIVLKFYDLVRIRWLNFEYLTRSLSLSFFVLSHTKGWSLAIFYFSPFWEYFVQLYSLLLILWCFLLFFSSYLALSCVINQDESWAALLLLALGLSFPFQHPLVQVGVEFRNDDDDAN